MPELEEAYAAAKVPAAPVQQASFERFVAGSRPEDDRQSWLEGAPKMPALHSAAEDVSARKGVAPKQRDRSLSCDLSTAASDNVSASPRESLVDSSESVVAGVQPTPARAPTKTFWLAPRVRACSEHADCAGDLRLTSKLLEILKIIHISETSVITLLKTTLTLRRCDVPDDDICCTYAHASVYFSDTIKQSTGPLTADEVGHFVATLVFLAHSFVQDRACSLKDWHKHIFGDHCSLRVLNSALMQLFKMRKFNLRVEDKILLKRHESLLLAWSDIELSTLRTA
eukprot:TRINITY_DN42765_c0_g1_i1.p1 TRINITY_DN42765_c0_g1~~TRINITY_DN42765_c0_g1_i1.p1  ORF type:complete len:284 (+),score=76.82 TRINITY_DN42765_c0_g1_i1:143-994(+)